MSGTANAGRVRLLWSIPIALALHNLEEAIGFRWLAASASLPEAWARVWSADGASFWRFDVALLVTALLAFSVAAVGDLTDPRSRATRILLVIQLILLVNAFWHAAAAIMLGGYAPGVITALLVNLPLSWVVLARNRREQWLSSRATWAALGIVVVLHSLPVLLLAARLRG